MSFTNIFSADKISPPAVLAVIKSNPTGDNIDSFTDAIMSASHVAASTSNPAYDIDKLIRAIHDLLLLPSAEELEISEIDESEDTVLLPFALQTSLSSALTDALHETALHVPKYTVVERSSPTLVACLVSASATEQGVLNRHRATYAITRQGLQLPNAKLEPARKEVLAIGACLHLEIAGKKMMDDWLEASDGHSSVVNALRKLDSEGVVTFPTGINLLRVSCMLFY